MVPHVGLNLSRVFVAGRVPQDVWCGGGEGVQSCVPAVVGLVVLSGDLWIAVNFISFYLSLGIM